ncbi:MAG TPA: transporter substrate-binding domain-containing protein [Actinomycetota bacterium]|nr:transporter substrate-binding domain-containing protein [Actinomycetota bacterium]
MRRRFLGALAVVMALAVIGAACAKSNGPSNTGTTGTSGTTATSGASGTTATSGTSGTTATSGPSGTTATSGPSGTTATSGPSGTTASIPPATTLKSGTLTVGSCLDYKPFEFTKNGQLQGFDVEIMEAIASKMGLSGVTWVKANFDTIFTALATGQKFDAVAAASTITPEREQIVDFSNPYYNARQSLTVNEQKTPDVKSTDDLQSGQTVGVQKGTTGKQWAEDNLQPKGIQVRTYTNITDAFTDLEAGRIVGIINDEPSSIAEAQDRPTLKVVEPIDTGEHYGIAINPQNDTLKPAIDAALAAIIADGTYKQIFTKYFPTLPLPPEFEPAS